MKITIYLTKNPKNNIVNMLIVYEHVRLRKRTSKTFGALGGIQR